MSARCDRSRTAAGALLARAQTATQSRTVSRALHGFAGGVREQVRAHHGHAIYTGGDDVLDLLAPKPADAHCCGRGEDARCLRAEPGNFGDGLGADLPGGGAPGAPERECSG